MTQLSLVPFSNQFGGETSLGKRKERRPVVTKRPMHLVFKSERNVLLKNARVVRELQRRFSHLFSVRIYSFSIQSNHLHLCVQAKSRTGLHHFNRALAGSLALAVSPAKEENTISRPFWKVPVYSRIVQWGKDFRNVIRYIKQNELESLGLIAYTPRDASNAFSTRRYG